jgi:hypothetical protein
VPAPSRALAARKAGRGNHPPLPEPIPKVTGRDQLPRLTRGAQVIQPSRAAGVEAADDAGTGSVSNTRSDIREVDVTVQQAPAYGMRQLRTPAMSAQLRRQRRAQADAIVRGVARSQAGRPAREIRQVLAAALRQVGVRPAAATLDGLAAAVSAGRPAALPGGSQRR